MKQENKVKGIAALFDQIEIKSFLKNYLIFIGIVEAVIFFVCFVEQLGSESAPFPWKNYFFSAFIVPVVITFLFGVLVAGFNKYIYGSYYNNHNDNDTDKNIIPSNNDGNPPYIKKIERLISLFQRLPFLLTLFILTITAGIIYKLDSIITFITAAGQKSFKYLSIAFAVIIAMASFFTIIWIILNYRLKKKAIEYKHSYRESVIKQLGVIILEDGTIIDKKGQILSTNEQINSSEKTNMDSLEKKQDKNINLI